MTVDKTLFALLLGIYLLTAGGYLSSGDEETMYRVTRNLAWAQGLAIGREELTLPAQSAAGFLPAEAITFPSTSAVPGVDSGLYSKYAPGPSLMGLPLFGLGLLLDAAWPDWPQLGPRLLLSLFNPLALALSGWLLFRVMTGLGYGTRPALGLALAGGLATFAWPYVNTFYPQPMVGLCFLAALWAIARWSQSRRWRWAWLLGLALALAALTRLTALIALPGVAVALWWLSRHWPERWGLAWRIGLPLGAALVVSLGYNWLRFGSPLDSGYYEVAWTTPPLLGLYGLLFSPGKGVFLYTPLLLISLAALPLFWRSHPPLAAMLVLWWLAYLAFYAPYNFWTGGVNWGPRFLLPLIPVSMLPLAALLAESKGRAAPLLVALLVAAGIVIQLPAVLTDHVRYLVQQQETGDDRFYDRTVYQPAYSPLVQQWPSALTVLRQYSRAENRAAAAETLQTIALPPAGSDINRHSAQRVLQTTFVRLNLPAVWWLHLPLWGLPGWLLALLLLPPVILLLWGAWGMANYEM